MSVSFGFQPSVQRLYQLGSFVPYDTSIQRVRTLQLGVYGSRPDGAGGSLSLNVAASVSCDDSDGVDITVSPASCLSSITPFTQTYFPTSYGYQKDNLGYGQESWSFTTRPLLSNYSGTIVMLRGMAEGTISTGPGSMLPEQMGVEVNDPASNDSSNQPIEGESGSVQAGSPGIGNFDYQRFIVATAVGGSMGLNSEIDGLSGNASVSIPMTPVFL